MGSVMEPISTGAVALALVKLGAGPASSVLKGLLAKKLLRLRVSWVSGRVARSNGIRISMRAIHGWLARSDVREQLAAGSAEAVESAVRSLAWLLPLADGVSREQQALILLELVVAEYHRAQSPQDAVVLGTAYARNQTIASTKQLSEQGSAQTTTILEAISAQAPEVFAEDLRRLHTWRAEEAARLADAWSPFRALVHTLVAQESRGSVLRDWAASTPEQLKSAPAEVWCWFGRAASDYDEDEAANSFIEEALARGAVPVSYWRAHMCLNLLREDSNAADEIVRVRAEMERVPPPHPLLEAYIALLEERFAESEVVLERWNPAHPHDRAIRAQLLYACAKRQKDDNRAIAIALKAAVSGSTGMMIIAARELMNRGFHGLADNRLEDFHHARSLAVKARDSRRIWQGDSVEAVLVAVTASILGTDWGSARNLLAPAPDGEATASEAQDPRLVRERALLAARAGDHASAAELAAEVGEPYVTATIRGWSALSRDDRDVATREWLSAWDLCSTDVERVQTATDLAFIGVEIPNLEDLAERQPEVVSRLRVILKVMSDPGDKLTILRARSHESAELTAMLDELLSREERYGEAAQALETAANRWSRPLLMHMAASRYMQAGSYADAVRASEAALTMAGPGWALELATLILRFNALSAEGLLTESIQVARRMSAIAPENTDVRWCLIHSLVRDGDSRGAWAAINYKGEPVSPRDVHDARIWIGLAAIHDTSPLFIRRSLAVMRRWPDDPDLMGTFLSQIHKGVIQRGEELQEADLEALQAASDDFIADHPNNRNFYQIKVLPDQNPLDAMTEIMRHHGERTAALADINARISRGEIPLGVAAELADKSYAEASLKRVAGFVYSHNPQQGTAGAEAANATIGKEVVLETTAAVTLALLDQAITDHLIGAFSSISSTDTAFRDALTAQESLKVRSTLSVGWDQAEQRPVSASISDKEADLFAIHADKTVQILRMTKRRGWPSHRHFTEASSSGTWLNTLDFAATTKTPLWSDDSLLRAAASSEGIPSFGTVDLLRELVRLDRIDPDLAQVAESVLIANYHVDLGFHLDTMHLAADIDGWLPGGAAANLSRAFSWQEPRLVVGFLHQALSKNAATSPVRLQQWITYAAIGLLKVADGPEAKSSNLRILLGQLVSESWMRPDILPYALAGIRYAIHQEARDIQDPLEPIFDAMYTSLDKKYGAQAAAELLLMWAGQVTESDRRLAARIILTASGRD